MHLNRRDPQVMETLFRRYVYQKIETLNQSYDHSGSLEIFRCHRQSINNYASVSLIRKTNSPQKHALYCKMRTSKQVDSPDACDCAETRYPMKVSFDSNSLWDDISIEEVRKASEYRSACVIKYGHLPLMLPGNSSVIQKISKGHRQCLATDRKVQRTGFESIVLSDRDIPKNNSFISKNDHLHPVYRMLTSVNQNLQPNKNLRKSRQKKKHPLSSNNTQFKQPVHSITNTANRIRILKKSLQ